MKLVSGTPIARNPMSKRDTYTKPCLSPGLLVQERLESFPEVFEYLFPKRRACAFGSRTVMEQAKQCGIVGDLVRLLRDTEDS